MSLIFHCQGLEKAFGAQELFRGLSFSVFAKDRIGLIGPNGCGKSTLLKMIAGLEKADAGSISVRKGLVIGYVPQVAEFPQKTPLQILVEELEKSALAEYEKEQEAKTWLSKLGFFGEEILATELSGGWKKRLSLAVGLIHKPDVLLLDEPTNHLDLEGVLWLEKFLLREAKAFVLVSHDRAVLQHLPTKILEINPLYPDGLFQVEGSYDTFLQKKALFIEGQQEQERAIAGKVRRETDWIRRSPKARTTKSQARVDAALDLFQKHQDVQQRNTSKTAAISFAASERETRQLVVLKNVCMEIGLKPLFKQVNVTLAPGTCLGLMGPNGSGKTTFLKLLAKELTPSQGTIKYAEDLKIVYFDQYRDKLPLDMTLKEALSPGGDYVFFQGREIHVNGWCRRFLFSPDILGTPLKKLSGGERARVAIARLMLQPADLLLLDEPTNDLDIETLETLEETLQEFPGAVVLITHDRYMLERLCNLFLSLGDPEQVSLYADYVQWETVQSQKSQEETPIKKPAAQEKRISKGLSYNEKREYSLIEEKITTKEKELKALHAQVASAQNLQELCTKIAHLEKELEELYSRWEELASRLQ